MNVLFESIYTEFSNNAALRAAVEDLYNTSAPQDTDMPYLVMLILSDSPNDTFNTDQEECSMQFSIFSKESSPDEIGDIFELLKACFDDVILSVTGYTCVEMTRLPGALLTRLPDMSWHYVIEYRVTLYKL